MPARILSHQDTYGRLVAGRFPPATSQPRPADFAEVYRALSRDAVAHSTTPDETRTLGRRLAAFSDGSRIHLSRLGPALGVHSGPSTLVIVLREATRTSSVPVPALGHSDSGATLPRP